MKFRELDFADVSQRANLVAAQTSEAIRRHGLPNVLVAGIDAKLADTAAFCEAYGNLE